MTTKTIPILDPGILDVRLRVAGKLSGVAGAVRNVDRRGENDGRFEMPCAAGFGELRTAAGLFEQEKAGEVLPVILNRALQYPSSVDFSGCGGCDGARIPDPSGHEHLYAARSVIKRSPLDLRVLLEKA